MIGAAVLVGAFVVLQTPTAPPSLVDELAPARLVYLPSRFEGTCPTEVEVQEGVARRIGRSPFAEPPTRIVVLALDGDGDTPTRARTELFDRAFMSLGARTIESKDGCRELVEAAELAISIALAPTLAFAPPPPAPTPIAPRVETAPLAADHTDATPPAPKPSLLPPGVKLVVGVGLTASILLGPEGAAGAELTAGFRVDELEFRIERRVHLPGFTTLTEPAASGQNSRSLAIVHGADVYTAAPCGHLPLFAIVGDGDRVEASACATASVGDVWAIGGYLGGAPYVGAGGRIGAEWTGVDLTSVRAWTQVELNIVKPTFYAVNGTPPWEQDAPVNVTFGITYEIPWAL